MKSFQQAASEAKDRKTTDEPPSKGSMMDSVIQATDAGKIAANKSGEMDETRSGVKDGGHSALPKDVAASDFQGDADNMAKVFTK